jgi:hypothetical protein
MLLIPLIFNPSLGFGEKTLRVVCGAVGLFGLIGPGGFNLPRGDFDGALPFALGTPTAAFALYFGL